MFTATLPNIRRFMIDWFGNVFEPAGESVATITIDVPGEILEEFGKTPEQRSRWVLEALAIEAYRQALFTRRELAAILDMPVLAFDEFLNDRKIANNVTVDRVIKGYNAGKKFLIPE